MRHDPSKLSADLLLLAPHLYMQDGGEYKDALVRSAAEELTALAADYDALKAELDEARNANDGLQRAVEGEKRRSDALRAALNRAAFHLEERGHNLEAVLAREALRGTEVRDE